MKKLFLLAGIMFFAFTAKAQEMNFEETVKYINSKLVTYEDPIRYKLNQWSGWAIVKKVTITNDGKFQFHYNDDQTHTLNLFELAKQPAGISSDGDDLIFIDRSNFIHIFWVKSISDAERLVKAFLHLRTLCTKEKDPFD